MVEAYSSVLPDDNYGFRKCCAAVQEVVPVEEVARRYTGLEPLGNSARAWFTTRCPLPNHEDRTPSFYIYPGQVGGRWWCYSCSRGGDVVDLYRLANGFGRDGRGAAEAAGYLLLEFGFEVPRRPKSWHRKQDRQQRVRELIERERIEHVRMLVFRLIFVPWLKRLPEWTRKEAARSAWESSRPIALGLYERRRSA